MRAQLVAVLLVLIHSSSGFDLTTYKQQFQATVGVPYKDAATIMATNIIEYLAQTPIPTTDEAADDVAATLKARVEDFSRNIGTASGASDGLRKQVDHEVENIVAQASSVQQQIGANEQQLQQTSAQIQQTNAQIAAAHAQVWEAEVSVQHAQQVLEQEQRRVYDAEHHCTWFGGWFGHKLCQVVNHGGINRAQGDRDRAQQDLVGRQQRLAQFQAQLAQNQQHQAQLQQQRASFEATKSQLNAQLAQLNQARDTAHNVDTRLKAVVTYLGTLLGKSQVLADVLKGLIDMETVINPLTAVADQIIANSKNVDEVSFLKAIKEKIATNLPVVQQKLLEYGLLRPSEDTNPLLRVKMQIASRA